MPDISRVILMTEQGVPMENVMKRKERIQALYNSGRYSYRGARRKVDLEDLVKDIGDLEDVRLRGILQRLVEYFEDGDDQ